MIGKKGIVAEILVIIVVVIILIVIIGRVFGWW